MLSQATYVQIEIILGSKSDVDSLRESDVSKIFDSVGVSWTCSVISAHRNPNALHQYCQDRARNSKMLVFIAAAGMAAALPGAVSAAVNGCMPVLGVALPSEEFPNAMDALLAMTRMPPGRPVACCGVGEAGWINAALMACAIIGRSNASVLSRLEDYQMTSTQAPEFNIALMKGV